MPRSNKNVFTTMGSSIHSEGERPEKDFYATHPSLVRHLMKMEKLNKRILEPMCGQGHISKTLIAGGHKVVSFDIEDRGYGKKKDFLTFKTDRHDYDIVSNPPYHNVDDYVYKCMNLMDYDAEKVKGNVGRQKTCLFLRLLFLEGKSRKIIFSRFPPVRVWVSSSRASCAKNGEFGRYKSSAMAYAWFIWESGYEGDTILKWFN